MGLCGCATTKLPGVTEYNKVAGEASKEVHRALAALDKIKAATPTPSKRVVSNFSDEVTRLQVQSVTIRARAQTIQARGDAYFRDWSENLALQKDAAVRERAEHYRPELERTFADIKSASSRAGAAFRPFLEAMVRLRAELESKPNQRMSLFEIDLVRAARENGQAVLKELAFIQSDLTGASAMLAGKAAPAL
jgi:hypothetical protein